MTLKAIGGKLDKLEAAAGISGGGCAMCAAREAQTAAEGRRELGLEWERGEAYPSEFNCPQCGKPFTIIFQIIQRRAA